MLNSFMQGRGAAEIMQRIVKKQEKSSAYHKTKTQLREMMQTAANEKLIEKAATEVAAEMEATEEGGSAAAEEDGGTMQEMEQDEDL